MFELSADDLAIAEVARQYADEMLAPHAVEWDRQKHFPGTCCARGPSWGWAGCTSGRMSAARN